MLRNLGSSISVGLMCLVITGLWGVSAFFNFRFGYQAAEGEYDALMLGTASVLIDALKSYLPFVLVGSYLAGRFLKTSIASFILLGCVLFSISNAIGYRARIGAVASSEASFKKTQIADLRLKRRRQETKLVALKVSASAQVITKKLKAKKQHKRWRSSEQCTLATAQKSMSFCKEYFELEGRFEKARQAAIIETDIQKLDNKIMLISGGGVVRGGDAQALLLANLLNSTPEKIQTFLVLLFGLLIEFAAGFGFYLVLNNDQQTPVAKRKKDPQKRSKSSMLGSGEFGRDRSGHVATGRDVSGHDEALKQAHISHFIEDCLIYHEGGSLSLSSFYTGYKTWSEGNVEKAMSRADFKEKITMLADRSNWENCSKKGGLAWRHLSIELSATPQLKVVS